MLLYIAVAVVVGLLVYVYMTYYNISEFCVVRYSRPDCPFCVSSQADWDAIKAEITNIPADKKANILATIKFVDIDTSKSTSLDTYMWKIKHTPSSVPNIITYYKGVVEELPTNSDTKPKTIEKFIESVLTKNNLIKK